MSTAASDSRKRSKKRYAAGHNNKRWRGCRELDVGMQGILITCNMNQRKCTAEAFNLLNEYADKLYGPEKVSERRTEFLKIWPTVVFGFDGDDCKKGPDPSLGDLFPHSLSRMVEATVKKRRRRMLMLH